MSIIEALSPGGALHAMTGYRHFCVYQIVASKTRPGKTDKLPCVPRNWGVRADLLSWDDALARCAQMGEGRYGVGYILQEDDPFFFLDIDGCLQADNTWTPIVNEMFAALPGAAFEVSSSGKGVHMFGVTPKPIAHSSKNSALGLELYTGGRLAALTGTNAVGDCATACDLTPIVGKYFNPSKAATAVLPTEWADAACSQWHGLTDDDELIEKFTASVRASDLAAAAFGAPERATNLALWTADDDALAACWPDGGNQLRRYDASSADMALASRLAYWTGRNPVRIERLMQRSALVRDKWDERPEYLRNTILQACASCAKVYGEIEPKRDVEWTTDSQALTPWHGEPGEFTQKMMASEKSDYRDAWNRADLGVVCRTLAWRMGGNCEQVLAELLTHPGFVDSQSAREGIALVCAAQEKFAGGQPNAIELIGSEAEALSDDPFFRLEQQLAMFKGYVFVARQNKIWAPNGELHDRSVFDVMLPQGVYSIGKDATTKKPSEAFLSSQLLRHPRVDDVVFRPDLPAAAIFEDEGSRYLNSYLPVVIKRTPGDVTPFLDHLSLMLPIDSDREILLSFMAALVQNPGVKFRWAPVLQGWEGNGKGLIVDIMHRAVGSRYFHLAQAADVGNKFNDWIVGKLLIGVNEVNVASGGVDMVDSLKTMVTDSYMGVQGKGSRQRTDKIFANFVFTTNRPGAMGKAAEGRRYAIFYTAQQTHEDVKRDMGGRYFRQLTGWLESGGYAAIVDYLATFAIPEHLNPAGDCVVAPRTSSFEASVEAAKGSVEQAIEEAIAEGQQGFRGGIVSSVYLNELLDRLRRRSSVSVSRSVEIMKSLGYEHHPGMSEGRSTRVLRPEHKKPRLFVQKAGLLMQLSPAQIMEKYQEANEKIEFDSSGKSISS